MKISGVLLSIMALLCLQGCFIFSKTDRRIKSPCVRVHGGGDCERHPINTGISGNAL